MSISTRVDPNAQTVQPVVRDSTAGRRSEQSAGTADVRRSEPAKAAPASEVRAAAEQLDAFMKSMNRSVSFRYDTASGRTVVNVKDAVTGESIRQIPSEEALRIAKALRDGAATEGILLDASA